MRAAARVEDALHELDVALRSYLDEEEKHGVPREVSAESVLGSMSPALVTLLLDHMPTMAHPWRVVDMRDGEPTKLVRDGYQGPIATVSRKGQGKRARPRWVAFVGVSIVSPPAEDEAGDPMPIDWSTLEEAQAACDAQLRSEGVTVLDLDPEKASATVARILASEEDR